MSQTIFFPFIHNSLKQLPHTTEQFESQHEYFVIQVRFCFQYDSRWQMHRAQIDQFPTRHWKSIHGMKFNSEFRTTFWFPALSRVLSKEAIWKWQVARWRRGSDDDKYLMWSSLNNSSRLEWIIEMMAMNHVEGPDLISLYRNSRDYSCTQLLWKKLLTCFIKEVLLLTICTTRTHRAYGKILLRKSLSGKIEGGLIIFMQLENRYVLNGIWLNSITKQDHQWWRYHRRLFDYQSPYF